MPPISVIENEHFALYYYPEEKVVHHVIHKPITGPQFRELLNCGTELLREKQATKWLSDDRNNSSLSTEDTEWGLTDWITETEAAGWKYWALIVPDGPDAQMSMTRSIQGISQHGVRIMVFTDQDEAWNWLVSR